MLAVLQILLPIPLQSVPEFLLDHFCPQTVYPQQVLISSSVLVCITACLRHAFKSALSGDKSRCSQALPKNSLQSATALSSNKYLKLNSRACLCGLYCRGALQAGLGQKRKAVKPVQPGGTGKRRYLDALDEGTSSDEST